MRAAVAFLWLIAGSLAQSGAAAQDGALTLSIGVWRREVAVQEPILVNARLATPAVQPLAVVPPYVDLGADPRLHWPLSFAVFDERGRRVPNLWEHARSGFELMAYGLPWWVDLPGVGERPRPRPGAWTLPPGTSGAMWINLLQFYPLDEPGRYHLTFQYDARPEMLLAPGQEEPGPEGVWAGHLEADGGSITIAEPAEEDREAAEFLRAGRERSKFVLSADEARPGLGPDLLKRFPQSTYALYARFYELWYAARHGHPPSLTEYGGRIHDFTAAHPDFPLNDWLLAGAGFYEWAKASQAVSSAVRWTRDCQRGKRDDDEDAQAMLAWSLVELRNCRDILRAAVHTEDWGVRAEAENDIEAFELRLRADAAELGLDLHLYDRPAAGGQVTPEPGER